MLAPFKKPIGLRRWLFYLTLSALLPALVFAGHAILEFDRVARAAVIDNLEHRSTALQQSLEQMIKVATTTVGVLADSDSAQTGDWRGLYDQAKRSISHDGPVRAVSLVDGNGDVIFHTSTPFGVALFKANDKASVDAALQQGRISVSGAFKAPISPKSVVAVSVPLMQGGQIRHVLRAIILTESIDSLLAEAKLPEDWVAGVTDSRGTLLARSLGSEKFVGTPASASFLEGMRRGGGKPFKGSTLEGVRTTFVVMPVQGGDWFLGLSVPESVLGAPLDRALAELAGFGLLWFALALTMAYAFGTYIIRQAQVLVDAVKAQPVVLRAPVALGVNEFTALLRGVTAVQDREAESTKQMFAARAQRDEVFDLYENAPCGYHSLDRQGRLVRMNATALGWLGYRWDEVQGRPMMDLLTPDSQARFTETFPRFLQTEHIEGVELMLVRKDGSTFPASINATAIKDAEGNLISSRSTVFDITEHKRLEAQLNLLARTDTLTGLSNLRDFVERGERELRRHQRHAASLAVLMMDIDHFKIINDRYGHDGGDLVLAEVAKSCTAVLRNIDLVARVGGEEFALMLPETTVESAAEVADRLRQSLASLSVVLPTGQTVSLTVSIGVAMCLATDAGLDAGLKRADLALYQAKEGGRNQVKIAVPSVAPASPV